jgi:hypothetical protein
MTQTYYLSSLDSSRFAPVRECVVLQVLQMDNGKPALIASLNPPVIGQDLDRVDDIATVLLTARHEGKPVDPIDEFPCFVHIAIGAQDALGDEDPKSFDDFQSIGWGELYRTADDARDHRFG